MDIAPWGDIEGKPIDARFLARMLKPYGITPDQIRIEDKSLKGYRRSDFMDAWSRYVVTPDLGETRETGETSRTKSVSDNENVSDANETNDARETEFTNDVSDVSDVSPEQGTGGKPPKWKRLADGRYWCSACMDAFTANETSNACPNGHTPGGFE
jgi:hypothetical protein